MPKKDWNAAYESENTPWDKGMAAPPLREFLESHALQGRVLVPGCGRGHDVRLLAAHGLSAVGMDLAAAAIAAAHLQLVSARESYLVADFLQLPPQHQGQYDWVVEHTCLCALDVDCRPAYADAVYQALKPGGHVLAIFYREVSDYNGEGPPHPISAAEIEDLFGTRFERVEAYVPQHTYPSRPVGSEEVVCLRRRG